MSRRLSDQFQLRLPDGMRDQLKAEADRHNRSTNAEIVARLQDSLHPVEGGVRKVWLPAELWERVEREANVTETDPNLIIVDAVDQAFPSQEDVTDRLLALTRDLNRRGLEQTPEGQKLLKEVDEMIAAQERRKAEAPSRPWRRRR